MLEYNTWMHFRQLVYVVLNVVFKAKIFKNCSLLFAINI